MTPALALDYLHALSADVRAGVALGADGALLAGAEELAAPARALLVAAGDAAEVEVATAAGTVFMARSERHVLVVACGPQALPSLARFDLRLALADLARGEREAA